MKLLSLDIGVHNVGWCEMEAGDDGGGDDRITGWGTVDLSPDRRRPTCEQTTLALLQWIGDRRGSGVDVVLIEQQSGRNVGCKVLSHVAQACARTVLDARAVFVSPRRWAAPTPGLSRSAAYRHRKAAVVEAARDYVAASPRWRAVLDAAPKRDDMSDALMMAVYYAGSTRGPTRSGSYEQGGGRPRSPGRT